MYICMLMFCDTMKIRLTSIFAVLACLTAIFPSCQKKEPPVYTTSNGEFSIIVDNTTETIRLVIEGGYNPHVSKLVSHADWLKADYLGTVKLEEYKDPDTGFHWLSGGEYPLLELSYDTYFYLDPYDERETDVIITTDSGNTLTLHVTQGDRNRAVQDDKPDYCFAATSQGMMMVVNGGGGMGGPRLADIKSANTDFEADWSKEEAIYLYNGKGSEIVNGTKGYYIVPLPWAEINESRLPDGEAAQMLKNHEDWVLVLNYTGNRTLPDFNYFALYNKYLGKLRFFYYLSGEANMKDINDHLWAITIPCELAACMEHGFSLPYDLAKYTSFSNYRDGRFTYLTTPYTDDSRFGSAGNIIPESGWWAFDLDLPEMHNLDYAALAKKEISIRMLSFNSNQISLQSVVRADIDGTFQGKMNLDALWKKPRSVSNTGSILSGITGFAADVLGNKHFGDWFIASMNPASLANPWSLGLGLATVGIKAISTYSKNLNQQENPDISQTGQLRGTIQLGMNGSIDTEGFIKGDRQSGLKFPTFTFNRLKQDAAIGEGVWNLETSPVAYYTRRGLTFEDEARRRDYIENLGAVALDYFFDPSSVRIKLNEHVFPSGSIAKMRIRMVPGVFTGKSYGTSLHARDLLGLGPLNAAFSPEEDETRKYWPLVYITPDKNEFPAYPFVKQQDITGMFFPARKVYKMDEIGNETQMDEPAKLTLTGLGNADSFLFLPFWHVSKGWREGRAFEMEVNNLPEISVMLILDIIMSDGHACSYTRTFPCRMEFVASSDEYDKLINGIGGKLMNVPYSELLYTYEDDDSIWEIIYREKQLRHL